MKCDMDLETGTVTAEFTLEEFQEVMDALRAAKGKPAAPARRRRQEPFRMQVESTTTPGTSYAVCIWRDVHGGQHGSCECNHHKFRGAFCKHLRIAELVMNRRQSILA